MQAHTDRIAHNPSSPTTPFIKETITFLWVNDAAIRLTDAVTIGDQCPGKVEIFNFCSI